MTRTGDESLPPCIEEHFSLRSVCWGYRDLFAEALRGLSHEGLIGPGNPDVTSELVAFLKHAESSETFAHVLKEFLLGLNRHTRWMMKLPGIFSDVLELGYRLSERRVAYAITYFTLFSEGHFGDKPAAIRALLRWLRRLNTVDPELVLAFLRNHQALTIRLLPSEVDLFINEGLRLFTANPRSGTRFLEGRSRAAENVIQALSRECRLSDIRSELHTIVRALTGIDMEIDDLGSLDSDYLIEYGSMFVCLHRWAYLPQRIRWFSSRSDNRAWYLLQGVIAAGMHVHHSFPAVHGHPEYTSLEDLVGPEPARQNLCMLLEYARVVSRITRHWPGAEELLSFGVEREFGQRPPVGDLDRMLHTCLAPRGIHPTATARRLLEAVLGLESVFDTAALLTDAFVSTCVLEVPALAREHLRACAFLPDFRYRAELSTPPSDAVVANLKERSVGQPEEPNEAPEGQRRGARRRGTAGTRDGDREGDEAVASPTCYLYDEWCEAEGEYFTDYCCVHECAPDPSQRAPEPGGTDADAAQVRRAFELLRPDVARRERYLQDGDTIDTDALITFLVDRHREPSPRMRFYEKPRILERDLAVQVLLDISGSTGESSRHDRFIDVQKRAALVLGEGLEGLGDRFAVCGFSGSGRENCEYFVYKDFDQPWDRESRERLMAAGPRSSTRMGPALRHSGYRLDLLEARTKLVVLLCDGRPMDSGYDPNSRYAQYDVRMACTENRRRDIHTFCITTNENTVADMQIMFPQGNYAILPRVRALPRVLPKLYLKLTT